MPTRSQKNYWRRKNIGDKYSLRIMVSMSSSQNLYLSLYYFFQTFFAKIKISNFFFGKIFFTTVEGRELPIFASNIFASNFCLKYLCDKKMHWRQVQVVYCSCSPLFVTNIRDSSTKKRKMHWRQVQACQLLMLTIIRNKYFASPIIFLVTVWTLFKNESKLEI